MRIVRSALITLSAIALMQAPALAQTPQELGWEAGVVAPSPLRGVWENQKLVTKSQAQKAKADAQAEIARVKKLRAGQKALCQEKIFVPPEYLPIPKAMERNGPSKTCLPSQRMRA